MSREYDSPGDVLADWWTDRASSFANAVVNRHARLQRLEERKPDAIETDAARSRLRTAWARYRAFLKLRPSEVDVRGIDEPPGDVVDDCAERFGFDPWD